MESRWRRDAAAIGASGWQWDSFGTAATRAAKRTDLPNAYVLDGTGTPGLVAQIPKYPEGSDLPMIPQLFYRTETVFPYGLPVVSDGT